MRHVNNSEVSGFTAQGRVGSRAYNRVARITMQTVDSLPPAYRSCVNQFGYVDVCRAFGRRFPVSLIAAWAAAHDGIFCMDDLLPAMRAYRDLHGGVFNVDEFCAYLRGPA